MKLGSGGCAVGCVSHTFIYLWLCWINMSTYCTFKNQNEARVFLYHCISEGRLPLENVQCHFHFILHIICLIKQRLCAQRCFVYSRYQGNLYFSRFKAPPAGREWICIFNKSVWFTQQTYFAYYQKWSTLEGLSCCYWFYLDVYQKVS